MTSRTALSKLSKDELIDKLLTVSAPHEPASALAEPPSKKQKQQEAPKRKQRKARPFDMDMHAQRHIALRLAYIGTNYAGFAWQDSPATPSHTTVEGQLVDALVKTCLISDRTSCLLSRGGRTDKGVSALGQVIALRLRSGLADGDGIIPAVGAAAGAPSGAPSGAAVGGAAAGDAVAHAAAAHAAVPVKPELDYCRMLNRVLPDDIRVLAWTPVAEHFSARFSATHRTYKYFFNLGGMDVRRMREAAALLVGDHDYRNYCKIAPELTNFRRRVLSVDLQPVPRAFAGGAPPDAAGATWEFTISGYAFLWHQVRNIVAVLFMVGEGKEAPSIVSELLDIERYPKRPVYAMASDAPLLLHTIGYEDLNWTYDRIALRQVSKLWQADREAHVLRGAMAHSMSSHLLDCPVANPLAPADADAETEIESLVQWGSIDEAHRSPSPPHQPLSERQVGESVEVRTKGKAK